MATLREILRKIGAVKKTQQITRAMNMVAASKLRTTQGKMERFEPYAGKFAEVLSNLASRIEPEIHPLLIKREEVNRVELLHFSADRGLCGSFNMNTINVVQNWILKQQELGREYGLTLVGKKGSDYFKKKGANITDSHVRIYGTIDISFVNQMTRDFTTRYLNGEIDEVHMIYTRFVTMAKQVPTPVKLIPIEPPGSETAERPRGEASPREETSSREDAGGEEGSVEYLYEPNAEELLIDLLPKHISVQIFNAFLQNEVSEHAARMAAMDNATKNCAEMVEELTLVYNKARQASITADLMDIVGGAEAIKKA